MGSFGFSDYNISFGLICLDHCRIWSSSRLRTNSGLRESLHLRCLLDGRDSCYERVATVARKQLDCARFTTSTQRRRRSTASPGYSRRAANHGLDGSVRVYRMTVCSLSERRPPRVQKRYCNILRHFDAHIIEHASFFVSSL